MNNSLHIVLAEKEYHPAEAVAAFTTSEEADEFVVLLNTAEPRRKLSIQEVPLIDLMAMVKAKAPDPNQTAFEFELPRVGGSRFDHSNI